MTVPLLRLDCFLIVAPEDIVDVYKDRVRVVLTRLKGEVRRKEHALTFERLDPVAPGTPFAPLPTPWGSMPLCPIEVFRRLRSRASSAARGTVAQCKDPAFLRRLMFLLEPGIHKIHPSGVCLPGICICLEHFQVLENS